MGRRGRLNLTDERLFFVTTTVVKFTPVFSYHPFCDILINNIKYYQNKYKFDILAYVCNNANPFPLDCKSRTQIRNHFRFNERYKKVYSMANF